MIVLKLMIVEANSLINFQNKKKLSVYKPLLKHLVDQMERISHQHFYNIEIKRRKEWDGVFHPDYKTFADLVLSQINESGIKERTTVQCFDVETLQYIHNNYPDYRLVYLVANQDTFEENMDKLGFTPYIYSPYYKLVSSELIQQCKDTNMLLIPWTVNDKEEMSELIRLGVNGIITDYPDILIDLISER